MKTCKNCKETKLLEYFYTVVVKGKVYPKARCKRCLVQYENDRRKNPEVRKKYIGAVRAWLDKNKTNPLQIKKLRARELVRKSVRDGTIIKVPCWCSSTETFAHHSNYDNPLRVVWLCRLHHAMEHKKLKNSLARMVQ